MKCLLTLLFLGINLAFGQGKFDYLPQIPVYDNGFLRFPWAGGINFPYFSSIDLNSDGLNDLFIFDKLNGRISTYTNNGGNSISTAWDYEPLYANQFPPVNRWAFLFDYNCDGKPDFFTLSNAMQCAGITVYKNITSSPTLLQWSLVDSCMKEKFFNFTQNIFSNAVTVPHFTDFDGDGDMDILGFNTVADRRVLYHKNYSIENFGHCDSLTFILENLCLGNFQLGIGSNNTVGCFSCPCRTGRPVSEEEAGYRPQLVEPIYDPSEAARQDDTIFSLMALDTDGDGFKELLIGDVSSASTLMVHNGGTEMDGQDTLFPSGNVSAFFPSYHFHSYIDVDNDSLNDLLVSANEHENRKGIWYYRNSGTNSSPVFNLEANNFLQGQMIDVGEEAAPVLFDYNNDSLHDLVISKAVYDAATFTYKAGLYLYRNNGTRWTPSFEFVTDDFAGLTSTGLYVFPTYPAFGDLDGDGDKDMLIGLEDGHIHYYENTAGPSNPASFAGPTANYMSIDIGKYATPQLFDLNEDGLLDIICGSQRGFVNYFQNRGSASVPLFDAIPTNDTLGCIVLQASGPDGYTVPFLYDSMGTKRLLVSNLSGNIYQYGQINGNLNGCFQLQGTVDGIPQSFRIKLNLTVSGGDLNFDGQSDIVIGHSTGGVEVRYQRSTTIDIREVPTEFTAFSIYPNPSKDRFTIALSNKNERPAVRIYDSLGRIMHQQVFTESEMIISTNGFSQGIYFVQLITDGFSSVKKLTISK